ncbi:MAG: tyrosine-type recombinase/integrase [Pseudomonadota bacterium]
MADANTSEFDRQYWAILANSRLQRRTFSALIESYRCSDRWTHLKSRTRTDYDRILRYLMEKIGTREIDQMRRQDVLAALQANRDRVRFANYIQQVLSILFEHAIDIGWTDTNPAKGVRKLKVPPSRRKDHIPWPDWAVDRFRSEARQLPLLIFELGVGSVQRPGDWPTFRWQDYDGESLRITQGKTGRQLILPCTKFLRRALIGASRRGLNILTLQDGRPMTYRRMSQIMRDERVRLGLVEYDLHALRYRGVMELACANCTDDEIAALSGHSSRDMIRKYAGEARQIIRARSASQKTRVHWVTSKFQCDQTCDAFWGQ